MSVISSKNLLLVYDGSGGPSITLVDDSTDTSSSSDTGTINTTSSSTVSVSRINAGTYTADGVSDPSTYSNGLSSAPSSYIGSSKSSVTINGTSCSAYAFSYPGSPYASCPSGDYAICKGANGNYYHCKISASSGYGPYLDKDSAFPHYTVSGYSGTLYANYVLYGWVIYGGKYYLYYTETTNSIKVYSSHSKTQSPTTVKPYQTFGLTLSGSCTLTEFVANSSTATKDISTVTYSSLAVAISLFSLSGSVFASSGNQITTAVYTRKWEATNHTYLFGGTGGAVQDIIDYGDFNIAVYCEDWDSKAYSVTETASSITVYAGQEIGTDFLSHFQLHFVCSNDYKSLDTTVQSSIEKASMSKTIFSDGDAVTFTYTYDSTNISVITNIAVIGLATGDTKFDKITKKATYASGDTLTLSALDIKNSGYLQYSDGTTIALSSLTWNEDPYATTTLGTDDTHYIDETTPEFDVSYHMNIKYFGSYTFTFGCTISGSTEDYITSVVMTGAKTVFNEGEILDFGSSAELKFYNADGVLKQTVAYADFSNYITTYPDVYGKKLGEAKRLDEAINAPFKVNTLREVAWSYVNNYMNPSLSLDTTSIKKKYILKDSFTLDTTGIVAKYTQHTNSATLGSTSVIDCSSSVTFANDTVDVSTGSKVYTVTASFTNSYGQVATGTYDITVIKYEPVSIRVTGDTDATQYYNNDQDTFHYPTGLTFDRRYSDDTYETITQIGTLEYYRDSALTSKLVIGKSIIKKSAGNVLYVYDPMTKTSGFFNISFKEDPITNLYIDSAVSIVLGNKLNSARSLLNVKCHHLSGVPDTVYTNYVFADNDFIMAKKDVVVSCANETDVEGTNAFTLNSTLITFTKPHIESIEASLNGFGTAYNNVSDAIDCNPVVLSVHYVGATYVQTCTLHVGETITDNSQFIVSASDTQLATYPFDGTTKLSMDLGTNSEEAVALTFTVQNAFDSTDTTNNTFVENITVLDILSITGISLLKVKTSYEVGDTFLSSDDDSSVQIYYTDANNNQKKLVVKLNSGFGAINIFPIKGTVFKTSTAARTVSVTAATNYNVKAEYSIAVNAKYSYSNTTSHNIVAVKLASYTIPNGTVLTNHYILIEKTDASGYPNTRILSTGQRVLAVDKTIDDVKVFGYIEDAFDKSMSGRVVLFDDYIPPIDGANNVTVKFPCYVSGNSDYIDKCHFGVLFGSNNAKNRLFVSGNPDYPNCDWHSGEVTSDNEEDEGMVNGNFSYFDDLSYCFYGETDNAIVGYDIVSNDKLLVLKDKSDKETTVYFRTPTLVTAIDGSGTVAKGLDDSTLYQEEFSLVKGNNSVAGISPKTVINFNGDSLFVSSDNSVVGLDLTGIIGDNQRYANSRSAYIDEDLRQRDLSKSFFWSNGKNLFFALPEKVFVTNFETVSDSQYEWWQIDISDAQAFLEVGNSIYYGTSEGDFRKFNDIYSDVQKVFVGQGGGTLVTEGDDDNLIIVSASVISQIDASAKYTFKTIPGSNEDTSFMYYMAATVSNVSNGTFDFITDATHNCLKGMFYVNGKYNSERHSACMLSISEERDVYLNHVDGENEIGCQYGSSLSTFYKKYRLKKVDTAEAGNEWAIPLNDCYYLVDADTGAKVTISELYRCALCYRLDKEYDVSDIDSSKQSFRIYQNGKLIDLVRYASQSLSRSFKAEIKQYLPVEAFYITKPFNMGSLDYFKTIWQWTLTNDTSLPSEMELTYASNKIPFEDMKSLSKISKDALCFDFSSANFAKLDFDKKVVPRTYTSQRILSNLKFVCFGFRNYNDTNSILSSMSVIYTVPMQSFSGD